MLKVKCELYFLKPYSFTSSRGDEQPHALTKLLTINTDTKFIVNCTGVHGTWRSKGKSTHPLYSVTFSLKNPTFRQKVPVEQESLFWTLHSFPIRRRPIPLQYPFLGKFPIDHCGDSVTSSSKDDGIFWRNVFVYNPQQLVDIKWFSQVAIHATL